MPAGLQHAVRFRKGPVNMGDIANAKGNCIGIKAPVGKSQAFGIAHGEVAAVEQAFALRPFLALMHHLGRNIGNRHMGSGTASPGNAKGDVARAARHIKHLEGSRFSRRIEHRDQIVFPEPVQARRTSGHSSGHSVRRPWKRPRLPGLASRFRPPGESRSPRHFQQVQPWSHHKPKVS